jgi:hypothetical protein
MVKIDGEDAHQPTINQSINQLAAQHKPAVFDPYPNGSVPS